MQLEDKMLSSPAARSAQQPEVPHFVAVKPDVQISSLSDERRHLAFRALAVAMMMSAYKQMPAPIVIEKSPSALPGELSDEAWNEFSRMTLRWLLLMGFLVSHEKHWVTNPYDWHEHTQKRVWIAYDLLLTDKGLTAIGKAVDWRDQAANDRLLEAAQEILGEGIKDAAKAKVGEMATDVVARVTVAFATMFMNGQTPLG